MRKLSLVFEHGLTMVNTSTSGVGVGVGVMVGAGRTRGHHVTAVSARAAPPRRRDSSRQMALAIGCFLLGFPYHIVWIGAALFGIAVVLAVDWNRREWPSLYATWDAKYMCERCGAIDFPVDQPTQVMVIADNGKQVRPIAPVPPALDAEAGAQKTCPHCRSFIPGAATVCRFCQRDVNPPAIAP